jgi:hypothetical protein
VRARDIARKLAERFTKCGSLAQLLVWRERAPVNCRIVTGVPIFFSLPAQIFYPVFILMY